MVSFELYPLGTIADCWLPVLEKALAAINKRSGNRYPPDVVARHLQKRIIEKGIGTAVWLFVNTDKLNEGVKLTDVVCGMITLDLFEDEIGEPVAMISRAWCEPGVGRDLWELAKPAVWKWADMHKAKRITFCSERDTAWAKFLQADGFQMKETAFEIEIGGNKL